MNTTDDELNKKAEMLRNRILSDGGGQCLAELGILEILNLRLSMVDLDALQEREVCINPVYLPASQNRLRFALSKNAQIITLDLNYLKIFEPNERVAIVLHEIGHAMNPNLSGLEADFIADQFAAERGLGRAVVSSLEKCKQRMPREFDNSKTTERLKRLRPGN